jgi:O-antigen/teichoic acid export membrane protein
MIGKHVGYYFGSKLFAALLNLISMALFVRLAGQDVYGGYIVAMAWAAIAYSMSLQWLRFAFFASYREDMSSAQIATYLRVLAAGIALVALICAVVTYAGWTEPDMALAVFVIVAGLAAYDAFHEIARTRLQARTVAIGVVIRSVLILVFGIAALKAFGTPLALAIAFGAAHWGGALALRLGAANLKQAPWSADAAGRLWQSGRPLIPAFAVDSFGLQFDRLILARHAGYADVGPYGAVSDFIRQILIVGSEAISGAYMALARADAVNGRQEAARLILGQAFRAYVMLTAFAAAFVMFFGDHVLSLMFGSDIAEAVHPVLFLIVMSNAIMVFRAYYFAQVLFVEDSSRLMLITNTSHAVIAAILGLTLIPSYGAGGAAFSLMMGHLVALLTYMWSWRGLYVTKLPYADSAVIALSALAVFAAMTALETVTGGGILIDIVNLLAFGLAAIVTAWRYRILSINEAGRLVSNYWARRREGSLP